MTRFLRTSVDRSTTPQPSALQALHAQVHELLSPSSPGYDDACSIGNGMIQHAGRRDLNVLLENEEAA